MEPRNWLKEKFGSSDPKTIMDSDVYSDREIREDKVRLERQRKNLKKEMNKYETEYQKLIEKGAGASDMEKRQLARRAEVAEKKYKIKQRKYDKNGMQMATVVTVEGARELQSMATNDGEEIVITNLLNDPDVNVDEVYSDMEDVMVQWDIDMETMQQAQEALDMDISGRDVGLDDSAAKKAMDELEAGEMDTAPSLDEQVSEEDEFDESGGIGLESDGIGPESDAGLGR